MAPSRNHQIGVTQGMSGYFAVMYAEYEDKPGEWTMDVEQTGIGRYEDWESAASEAKDWAKLDNVPYIG